MPTGYTSFIEDGKVRTPKEFLHLCLRNFGVCSHMRDESLELKDDYTKDISDGFQKDIDYHQKNLDEARERLKTIQEMSEEELCGKYITETKKKIKDLQRGQTKEMGDYADYLRIKEGIENWECSEEFQNIKDFALNQIDISIPRTSYYDDELAKIGKPTVEGFKERKDEYLKSLIADAEWDINYHSGEIDRTLKLRDECLDFYKRFKEELENLK
jgi:hypothetical protein